MKLLCIKGAKIGDTSFTGCKVQAGEEIFEGETYTKEGEYSDADGTWYYLKEKQTFSSYNANRFIPLSSIDETEMERNYKTEKV